MKEMRKRRVTLAVYDRPSAEIPAPPSLAAREGLVIRMTLWNVIREPLVRDVCAHTTPHVINMLPTLGLPRERRCELEQEAGLLRTWGPEDELVVEEDE